VRTRIAAVAAVVAVTAGALMVQAHAATDSDPQWCAPVMILGLPGTGEGTQHHPGSTDRNDLYGTPVLQAVNAAVAEGGGNGKVSSEALNYPASFNYWASKDLGYHNAWGKLTDWSACRHSRFALIGYSQGAHIAGDLAATILRGGGPVSRDQFAGAVLIADPAFSGGPRTMRINGHMLGGIGLVSERTKWSGQDPIYSVCFAGDTVCDAGVVFPLQIAWTFALKNYAAHFWYSNVAQGFQPGRSIAQTFGWWLAHEHFPAAGQGTLMPLPAEQNVAVPTPTPAPGPVPAGGTGSSGVPCETYVADTTLPDGSAVAPGQQVTKIWTLRNCGSTWNSTSAALVSGVGAPTSFAVPAAAGGTTGAVSLPFTAPTAPGHYRWVYRLVNNAGAAAASHTFWLDFNVVAGAPPATLPQAPAPIGKTDCSAFSADVTIPDGSIMRPGQVFTKNWKLRNCGTSDWSGLHASRVSGQFGPAAFAVSQVAPNGTTTLGSSFTAPSTPGAYRSTYRLQGADGHFAANSFWVEIVVQSAPVPGPSAPAPAPNRLGVVSYDRLTPGAAHAEWYQAWQDFTAASNTLTRLAINVGDPRWAPGPIPLNTTIRLCRDSGCTQQVGAWQAQINNYGATTANIGDFAVTPGTTYYLRYDRPDTAHTWAVYFWGPGTYNNLSCTVLGYNR